MYKKSARQIVFEPIRIGTVKSDNHQSGRIYSYKGKSVTLKANGGGGGAKTGLYIVPYDGKPTDTLTNIYKVENDNIEDEHGTYKINLPNGLYYIRKLTPLECKRLQNIRDNYIMPVSATQQYKMLGNGWTVGVIAHILSFANLPEKLSVLSMYDGMSCGQLALEALGIEPYIYYASEIDKYAISTTQANFPNTAQLGDAFNVDAWKLTLHREMLNGNMRKVI